MSDEGMTPMSDDSVANIRRLATDKLQRGEPVTTSGTPWLTLLARLDVAERERDALREALQDIAAGRGQCKVCKALADMPSNCVLCDRDGWHCAFEPREPEDVARAALTANHSAPQEQQP